MGVTTAKLDLHGTSPAFRLFPDLTQKVEGAQQARQHNNIIQSTFKIGDPVYVKFQVDTREGDEDHWSTELPCGAPHSVDAVWNHEVKYPRPRSDQTDSEDDFDLSDAEFEVPSAPLLAPPSDPPLAPPSVGPSAPTTLTSFS